MIFGYPTRGDVVTPLTADKGYLSKHRLLERGYVQKISALLDGLGDGIGDQSIRAVIYDSAGTLIASSSANLLPDNQPLGWIDFAFRGTHSPGVLLDAGDYLLGLQAAGVSESARAWGTDGVINIVTDPSFETNTTAWAQNAATGSFVRDPASGLFGAASLHQTNPGRNANEGARTDSFATTANLPYMASMFVRGVAGIDLSVQIIERDVRDAQVAVTSQQFTTTGDWQEVSVGRTFGSTGVKARIAVIANTTAAAEFWIDGAMLTQSALVADYFDGDTAEHVWLGNAHASMSAIGKVYSDTFSDGVAVTVPGASTASRMLSLFATYTRPYAAPAGVDDEYLSSLPFDAAQATLGSTQPIVGSDVQAQCGWHGTLTDPDRGMVAIVQSGGPLADLVGERIKLTYDERSLVVFVTSELDVLDDISLTRRGFMALEMAAAESITVTIEVLAGTNA